MKSNKFFTGAAIFGAAVTLSARIATASGSVPAEQLTLVEETVAQVVPVHGGGGRGGGGHSCYGGHGCYSSRSSYKSYNSYSSYKSYKCYSSYKPCSSEGGSCEPTSFEGNLPAPKIELKG